MRAAGGALFVLVVAATLHRPGLAAQSSESLPFARPTASCSFDTAARMGTPDTLLIALAPGPRLGSKPDLQADYLFAAEAIRQQYRAPQSIWVPLWARLVGDSAKTGGASNDAPHGFDGEVRFRLDATGRLATDSIAVETLNDDLAASVAAAIRRADSARGFGPPSKKLLKDHGIIRLHFVAPRGGSAQVAPLLRVIVPTVRLDEPPGMQSRVAITYPVDLRRARISGRVTVQFVVGPDGRPIQSTISVVEAEYLDFVIAAVEGVPGMKFKPARIGNCDVPLLVRVPFDFNIR